MINPLKYVFYRILAWKLNERSEAAPLLTAIILTAVLLYFNLLALASILDAVAGWRLSTAPQSLERDLILLAIVLLIAGAIYFVWAKDGRIVSLMAEYRNESRTLRLWRTAFFWIYVVTTAVLPFFLAAFLRNRH